MLWLALAENYSFVVLALGQQQLLILLLGFFLVLGLTFCWRRQSPLTLLVIWLIYFLSPLAGLFNLPQMLAAVFPTAVLPVLQWLPPVISAPCDTPFEARFSTQVLPLLPFLSWHLLLAGLWAAAVIWRTHRLWQSRRRFRTLVADAEPLNDVSALQLAEEWRARYRIARVISWRTSRKTEYAFTLGWLRPVVLLPEWMLAGLKRDELDIVIGHELAHVKRWDDFFLLLQQACKTVFFFNPMLWFSNRKIDGLREQCCDLLAVRTAGLTPLRYARILLDVADHYTDGNTDLQVVAGLVSADLRQRVTGLLRVGSVRFGWLPVVLASTLLLLLNLAFEIGAPKPATRSEGETILRSVDAVSPLPNAAPLRPFMLSAASCATLPRAESYHPGVDFVVPPGTVATVRAISDGRVVDNATPAIFGMIPPTLRLRLRNDITATYSYIDELRVQPGEQLRAGQVIGYIHGGRDGKHLHVAVQQRNRVIDPSFLSSL